MLTLVPIVCYLQLAYGLGTEEQDTDIVPNAKPLHIIPYYIRDEIMKTFPGVNNDTLLVDFLSNETYIATLMSIQLQMCYFDLLGTHKQKNIIEISKERKKRDLFPANFWETDVHHGYYYFLKHLDPRRWWREAFDFMEIKSSLPPLYYVAKYCPNEIRFARDMDYHEEFYPNLTWPPGLDPLWTGDPNKTTNIFTLLTESSSSESFNWYPYSGESTTTGKPDE